MSAEKIDELILNLEDSKTINIAYHTDDPNVGMPLTTNINKYKLYVGDTGLFVTLAFWDKDYTENIIYQKLLGDKLSTNMGYVFESPNAKSIWQSPLLLYFPQGCHPLLRDRLFIV